MEYHFHNSFTINGNSFSDREELFAYASSLSKFSSEFFLDWFSKEPHIEVQTSGSTGEPKKILLKKEFMMNSAFATGAFFNLDENTNALLCLSSEYIAGKMMLLRAMLLGWNLDIVDPVSNPLELIEKQYDFVAMVPFQLQNSLNELHKVVKLIVGGGVVSIDLKKKIQGKSTKIYATYGMTETSTHVAVKKLNNFEIKHDKIRGVNVEESIYFTVFPKIEISIDSRNCLVIDAPELSDEVIITNDVVQLISESEFEWVGRFDNVINSGGVKLYPEKIEKHIAKHLKRRFFITGISDSKLGKKLILVVEGKKNNLELSMFSNLSKYETPKEIYYVEHFKETKTKKILRTETLKLVFNSNT